MSEFDEDLVALVLFAVTEGQYYTNLVTNWPSIFLIVPLRDYNFNQSDKDKAILRKLQHLRQLNWKFKDKCLPNKWSWRK